MTRTRILLVDDEREVRELFGDALQAQGYVVDVAGTMAEAQARLSTQPYDVVITDWRLPDGDGRVIAAWAAELGAKTFVMSGYLPYMSDGRALGHETLMKPIQLKELIASIKRAVVSQ